MVVLILTLIVLAVLALLLASGVPIAFALLIAGGVGLYLGDGMDVTAATLARMPYNATASYTLVVIPMFMLMGALANHGGMAQRAFDALARLLRRVPGGLGLATLGACTAFAAVSGSSIATIVTIGRTSVEEMSRKGYDRKFAAGIVGVAGTLGILIPPSIALVIFGVLTGVSVGDLLIAGIIPGLLSAAMYGVAILWRVKRRPADVALGAAKPETEAALDVSTPSHSERTDHPGGDSPRLRGNPRWGRFLNRQPLPASGTVALAVEADSPTDTGKFQIGGLLRIAFLFLVVMGGIYSGVVTVIEAAALGVLGTLLITVLDNAKRPGLLWRRLWLSLRETAGTVGMLLTLFIGAAVFTRFTVAVGIPQTFTEFVSSLDVPPIVIMLVIFAALLALGMFLDGISILLVVVPITWPVVSALGYDGIWYGILFIKFIEVGMITPPVGLNAFALSGTIKGLKVEDAFKGLFYFLPFEFITIALLIAFPSIVTWLPAFVR